MPRPKPESSSLGLLTCPLMFFGSGPGSPCGLAGGESFMFTGEKGGPLRPHVLQKAWIEAKNAAGIAGAHLHDLRHAGNTWAATTAASTKELMHRMGHASSAGGGAT